MVEDVWDATREAHQDVHWMGAKRQNKKGGIEEEEGGWTCGAIRNNCSHMARRATRKR
jgi:hypothetical protein